MRSRIVPLAVLLLSIASAVAAADAPDPIGEALFAPELVMQHQQAIGLSPEQKETLKREIRQAQLEFTELQWKLQDEAERMIALVGETRVDEAATLEQLDAVLAAERAVKRRQIGLLVRIKNTLNAAQQAELRALRSDVELGDLW